MRVGDVMTTNVVTIPSHTNLADARRIIDAHRIRRLPVVDRGKLVGIVTKDALDRTGPSQLTTFSIHEIGYLLSKITVKEIMQKDVVTVTPDMTVEEAVALAQSKRVGALIVTEGERIVGIATTNDFFYKILNPMLGIGMAGSRIVVRNCCQGPEIEKVVAAINKLGIKIVTLSTVTFPEAQKHDLMLHLDTEDPGAVIEAVKKLGFSVEERAR
jgi:acetoin utilization protein AcuB